VESEGTYSYQLAIDTGEGLWHRSEWIQARMGATQTALLPNRPNPFNPRTTLHYRVARTSRIVLEIFDSRGRRVRTLDQGVRSGGDHTTIWDGRNEQGHGLASGVYTV